MPGKVLRGATLSTAAVWQDGLLLEKDGITPLLTKRGNGWAIGNQAASAWRMQGNALFKGNSSEAFCRIVKTQVLKGNSYEVMFTLVADGLAKANGRDMVVRGAGLTAEELLLAAVVLDKL